MPLIKLEKYLNDWEKRQSLIKLNIKAVLFFPFFAQHMYKIFEMLKVH